MKPPEYLGRTTPGGRQHHQRPLCTQVGKQTARRDPDCTNGTWAGGKSVELPQALGKHRPLPGLCWLLGSRAVVSQEQLLRCVYAIPALLLGRQTSPATTLTLGRHVHQAPR